MRLTETQAKVFAAVTADVEISSLEIWRNSGVYAIGAVYLALDDLEAKRLVTCTSEHREGDTRKRRWVLMTNKGRECAVEVIRPAWPFVAPVLAGSAALWVTRGPELAFWWTLAAAPFTWAVITNWFPGREWKDG